MPDQCPAMVPLFLIPALLWAAVEGCSPEGWSHRTPTERTYDADIVIYGRVLRHFPDLHHTQDDVYTAEMTVHCVIKGPQELRANQVVNISEAGGSI